MEREPSFGLTLSYFRHFIDLHGGVDKFHDLTTATVCTRFVLPYTATSRLSLVDHVRHEQGGDAHAKPAQWLISHSWSYKFLDVVDAIANFCHEQELGDDTSFWFCMFANNQHVIGNPSDMFDVFLAAFRTALADTGKLVMVLSPWHDPETLKRTWCVYEVYLSIVLHARFEVALGKAQKQEFLRDISERQSVLRMLGQINSRKSQTTVPSDRDHIFQLIDDSVGCVPLDRLVFDVMQSWILRTLDGQAAIAATPDSRVEWMITKAMKLFEDDQFGLAYDGFQRAVEVATKEGLASQPWLGWYAQLFVGISLAKQHSPRDAWEPTCADAFSQLQELVPRDHFAIFRATMELGEVFCTFGDYARGMSLLDECLSLAKTFHKPRDVYDAMHCIGMYLSRQNNLAEAEAMLRLAYEGSCEVVGDSHKETLSILYNLATCYSRQGRYDQAERLMATAMQTTLRTCGAGHVEIPQRWMGLGCLHRLLGKYDTAKMYLDTALDGFNRLDNRVWAQHSLRNLGLLCMTNGDLSLAAATLANVHATYLKTFDPTHPFCRGVLFERFVVLHEVHSSFDTVAKVAAFAQLLHAAAIADDTWTYASCHACYVPITGDMVVCMQCPPFSMRFCRGCIGSPDPHLVCGHSHGPWKAIPSLPRHMQDQRRLLLAK